MQQWDQAVDVLVVGSGNGALTAALSSYESGVKDILVIEKSDKFGGTSAVSGGGVWIPNNHYARECGATDSTEDALAYLKSTIPENDVPLNLIETYVKRAPEMMSFMHEHMEHVNYISLEHYPDYYMQNPGARAGHRSLEPEPINKSELGDDAEHLQDTHHMMYMFNKIAMSQVEAHILMTKSPGWFFLTLKLFARYFLDIPWLLKNKRSRRIACGSAGIARLYLCLRDRNIPLWRNCQMKELVTAEDGQVVGVIAEKNGSEIRIQARKGVILAAGGFEQNQEMREQYLPKPTNTTWSGGVKSNTGDAHKAGMAVGAKTRLMNGAWWCTTISAPDEDSPRLSIIEKSMPGSCVVNLNGKRIANESQNYMAYQLEFFDSHSEENSNVPAYMIFDARFRNDYIVGPLMTPQLRPDNKLPQEYFANGFMAKANTIEELAEKLSINKENLKQTIQYMNADAATGKDREFGRGDTEYDRYYGDPSISPNPCLAPIDRPPFYAIKIDPGDFGTHGGLEINEHAQVISQQGEPIKGLYACGNCAAAVLPTYPGPGSTLGPAMTFAYLAAKHISEQ